MEEDEKNSESLNFTMFEEETEKSNNSQHKLQRWLDFLARPAFQNCQNKIRIYNRFKSFIFSTNSAFANHNVVVGHLLTFANIVNDPLKLLIQFQKHGVARNFPLFWAFYANQISKRDGIKSALLIYEKGSKVEEIKNDKNKFDLLNSYLQAVLRDFKNRKADLNKSISKEIESPEEVEVRKQSQNISSEARLHPPPSPQQRSFLLGSNSKTKINSSPGSPCMTPQACAPSPFIRFNNPSPLETPRFTPGDRLESPPYTPCKIQTSPSHRKPNSHRQPYILSPQHLNSDASSNMRVIGGSGSSNSLPFSHSPSKPTTTPPQTYKYNDDDDLTQTDMDLTCHGISSINTRQNRPREELRSFEPEKKRRKLNYGMEKNSPFLPISESSREATFVSPSDERTENIYPPQQPNPWRRSRHPTENSTPDTDSLPPLFADPSTMEAPQDFFTPAKDADPSETPGPPFENPLSQAFRKHFITMMTTKVSCKHNNSNFEKSNIQTKPYLEIFKDYTIKVEGIISKTNHSTTARCDDFANDSMVIAKVVNNNATSTWECTMEHYLIQNCDSSYCKLNFVLVNSVYTFNNASIGIRPYNPNFIIAKNPQITWNQRSLVLYFLDLISVVEHLHSVNVVCGNITPETVGIMSLYHLFGEVDRKEHECKRIVLLDFSNSFSTENTTERCHVPNPEPNSIVAKLQDKTSKWIPFNLDTLGMIHILSTWLFGKESYTLEEVNQIPHSLTWTSVFDKLEMGRLESAKDVLLKHWKDSKFQDEYSEDAVQFETHLQTLLDLQF